MPRNLKTIAPAAAQPHKTKKETQQARFAVEISFFGGIAGGHR